MSSITEPDHHLEYSFASPRKQLLAFPPDVFSRMLENPSSHAGLMKLYQTCKYFYAKRPILIADDVEMTKNDGNKDACQIIRINLSHDYKYISHLRVPLWLTNELSVDFSRQERLPKLFRSSINTLLVIDDLQYDDFEILVSEKNVTLFKLYWNASLYHSDKSKVPMEEVLQHLPNVKEFWYFIDEKCSLESLIKLNRLKFSNKYEFFGLFIDDVDPTFDFNLFCEFIMKNCDAKTEFYWCPCLCQNVRATFVKMDSKWKTEALDGLKELFRKIESNGDS